MSEEKLLTRASAVGSRVLREGASIEELRSAANMMLFYLWLTDKDPNKVPWPGGPEEEQELRLLTSATEET